jgi:multiple sugar transport system ATP-binding protein
MIFLKGKLKKDRDSFVFSEIEGGAIEARLPMNELSEAREFGGKSILLGIRPEDIELVREVKDDRSRPTFSAMVDIVEPMGPETNLYLQTGAHTVVCRTQRALGHGEAGQRLQFEINVNKAHLFDPVTGKRVKKGPV